MSSSSLLHCVSDQEAKRLRPLLGASFFEGKDFNEFLHLVLDDICGKGEKLVTYVEESEVEGVSEISTAYILFYRAVLKKGLTKEQITEDLNAMKVEEKYHSNILDCLSAREEELQKALQEESTHISQSYLKDFDWKLQLAISSDKVSSIKEPLLQLNLNLQQNDKQQRKKDVLIELPKQDLEKFIKQLEEINEMVQELKV